jgi:pimeloyl-ACP methyl ester carboxylesterase
VRAELTVFDGLDNTASVMRSVVLPQSVPVRVITAGRPWWPTADRNQAWRLAHERLAASAADGRLIVAERSGHRIDRDQPEIIVDTVAALVRPAP